MNRAKHTFLLFAAILLLAACGEQLQPESSATRGQEEVTGSASDLAVQLVVEPYEWDFSGEVVINGLGLGSAEDSFLDDGGTSQDTLTGLPEASELYAQGILKGFGSPTAAGNVTLSTPSEDHTEGTAFTTVEHGAGAFYEHVFDGDEDLSALSIEVQNQTFEGNFLPRGLVAYSFVPDSAMRSIGIAPYRYIFGEHAPSGAHESWSETIDLGSDWNGGDIDVTFVIGDMQDDDRGVVLTIDALDSGGVPTHLFEASPIEPNDGTAGTKNDELLIHNRAVSPPEGTVAIRATVWSPPYVSDEVDGDSVYWTGLNLTYGVTGAEGCTPGYWRQPHHYDSWPNPYDPEDLFEDIFDRDVTLTARPLGTRGRPVKLTDPVLGEAVAAAGGGVNAVARHAVAGLLNAASPDVDYRWTEAEVIAVFQQAFDGDISYDEALALLVPANEEGCPLN